MSAANRTLRPALFALLVLAPLSRAPAQDAAAAGRTEALRAKIDALVRAEQEKQRIPAIGVAVAAGGRVVHEAALGMADLENGVAAKTTTRFRTASIAKPMTAVAVMQLAAQGKLGLDDDVRKHCPEFPEKPWPVTIRQVLGHLGGIRHYKKPGEASGTRAFATLADSLACFKDDPLLHEPGTKYHYSTYGYTLLGRAIETASGEPYDAYMQKRVFEPAGMTQTRSDSQMELIRDRARGYQRLTENQRAALAGSAKETLHAGDVVNAELHDTSMKVPGGGLLSTAGDLVRFAMAIEDGRLLPAEWRTTMLREQATTDGKGTGYGCGFGVRRTGGKDGDPSAKLAYSHSGGQAGAACLLQVRCGTGASTVAVALMTNLEGAKLGPLAQAILDCLDD